MFQTKPVEKIKTHTSCSAIFFPKIVTFRRLCRKDVTAGQATDENIVRCLLISCWIPKFPDTQNV